MSRLKNAASQSLVFIILLLLCLPPILAHAQGGDETTGTGVYVTTQDLSSLRVGPGKNFERLTVLDPALTLPAVGRTADTSWVQVEYEGEYGWIAAELLVWSGDLISLPVDGMNPAPFIRRANVVGITVRETPIYLRDITPEALVGVIPPGVQVELTGRLGSRGYFRFQIRHGDDLYWVGSWNIRVLEGRYTRLLDISYLYAYGRLITTVDRDIRTIGQSLSRIEDIWRRLGSGQRVSCSYIPPYASRRTTSTDVRREPNFAPTVTAIDTAVEHIDAAISAFADACGRADDENFYLTQQDVNEALDEIDNGRRNLNLAHSLLNSLRVRDPLLNP